MDLDKLAEVEAPKSMAPIQSHTHEWSEDFKQKYNYLEEDRSTYFNVIEGNTVILRHKQKGCYFTPAAKGVKASVFKNKVKVDNVIGARFGDVFEMKDKDLIKVESYTPDSLTEITDVNFVPSNDNSQLIDKGKFGKSDDSQTLGKTEIEQLKHCGKTGKEIAEILAKGSTTFETKTEFSQEKYIQKKKKKYDRYLDVLPPTVANVAEVYFLKNAKKILHMRPDILALLLSYGNPQAGSISMVIDSTSGLVTAGVAARQGGFGHVLSGYGGSPSMEAFKKSLMPQRAKDAVKLFPLTLLGNITHNNKPVKESFKEVETLLRGECDSLIIATKYSITHMFLAAFPFLAPSGCFAVYSDQIEPLAELWETLRAKKYPIVQTQIIDTWLREHQVLPNRTHPLVRMSSTGGYLFTGIKTVE